MTTVLGMDISSTTIGWGLLNIDISQNITLIDCGHIKPPKTGNLIEDLAATRDEILNLLKRINPNHIGIENIVSFMGGKSTANTIIVLTTFNRMICLLAHDHLNKSPELFNVMTIRHGLKIGKILPKKEEMPELVAKHLGITFPYEYETGKRSKKTKISEESYDTADGISVALYYAFVLTGKIKPKKMAPTKKTSKKGSKN